MQAIKHSISSQTLTQLYYALVYPFLTCSCMVWGSNYNTNINPFVILQKRTIRIFSFAKTDIVCKTQSFKTTRKNISINCILLFQFSKSSLPKAFDNFFTRTNTRHSYHTRLSSKSSFALPNIGTNYGKFNISFFGPKVCNQVDAGIDENCFKREL